MMKKNIIELLEAALDHIYPAMHGVEATPSESWKLETHHAHMKIEIAKTNIEEALKILKGE